MSFAATERASALEKPFLFPKNANVGVEDYGFGVGDDGVDFSVVFAGRDGVEKLKRESESDEGDAGAEAGDESVVEAAAVAEAVAGAVERESGHGHKVEFQRGNRAHEFRFRLRDAICAFRKFGVEIFQFRWNKLALFDFRDWNGDAFAGGEGFFYHAFGEDFAAERNEEQRERARGERVEVEQAAFDRGA